MTGVDEDAVPTVRASDGQYRIEDSVARTEVWQDPEDGLTTGQENWIAIITGTQHGPVTVHSELLSGRPHLVMPGWDMVGERDIVTTEGVLHLTDLYHLSAARILHVQPGRCRVRIHVRDRATAAQHNMIQSPMETHLIQIWHTEAAQPTALLVGPDEFSIQNY